MEPLKLFISYSHQDDTFKNELIVHLSSLKRNNIISDWHDRMLLPGQSWDKKIKQELLEADIILLLISPDFIASDYCFDTEVKRALERHEKEDAKVIPIILRDCDWKTFAFGQIQGLPKDAKPIAQWNNRDEGYLSVVNGLKLCIDNWDLSRDKKKYQDIENPKTNIKTFSYPYDVIIFKLPRGFVVIESIEFQEYSHWSVDASYYDYDGDWKHGTHYHDSYNDWRYPDGEDAQCKKLKIPKGDWIYGRMVLYLIIELRNRDKAEKIESILSTYKEPDNYFEYHKAGQVIPLPTIPEAFIPLSKSGEIRDIIAKLETDEWKDYDIDNLRRDFSHYRRNSYLILSDILGITHPVLPFVKEVIDSYQSNFNLKELKNWGYELSQVLQDTIKYIE